MVKSLVISNESYGRNNIKIALKEGSRFNIETVDLHDLCESLIAEHEEEVVPKMDFLGEDILEAKETYKEDYTEDYTLLYFNGGEKMYAFKMQKMEIDKKDVDLWVE